MAGEQQLTLEELLAGCDPESLRLTDEDREWIDAVPVGKEVLDTPDLDCLEGS